METDKITTNGTHIHDTHIHDRYQDMEPYLEKPTQAYSGKNIDGD